MAGVAEHCDGEVAQAGHGAGRAAGADLAGVFGVGDVADVVQGLDAPVAADELGEVGGPGCLTLRTSIIGPARAAA